VPLCTQRLRSRTKSQPRRRSLSKQDDPVASNDTLAVALRLLRNRDYFVEELRRALWRRSLPEEEIEYVIEVCLKRKYLNDLRLAREIAHRLDFKKHYGPARIEVELRKRFAPPDVIEKAMRGLKPERETVIYAVADLRRKGVLTPAQIARRLASRGFSSEAIEAALDELVRD
jgi:SOS response regulatory protein OraA/RecX